MRKWGRNLSLAGDKWVEEEEDMSRQGCGSVGRGWSKKDTPPPRRSQECLREKWNGRPEMAHWVYEASLWVEFRLGLGTLIQSSAKAMKNKPFWIWLEDTVQAVIGGRIFCIKCGGVSGHNMVLYGVKKACLTRGELNLNCMYDTFKTNHEASYIKSLENRKWYLCARKLYYLEFILRKNRGYTWRFCHYFIGERMWGKWAAQQQDWLNKPSCIRTTEHYWPTKDSGVESFVWQIFVECLQRSQCCHKHWWLSGEQVNVSALLEVTF